MLQGWSKCLSRDSSNISEHVLCRADADVKHPKLNHRISHGVHIMPDVLLLLEVTSTNFLQAMLSSFSRVACVHREPKSAGRLPSHPPYRLHFNTALYSASAVLSAVLSAVPRCCFDGHEIGSPAGVNNHPDVEQLVSRQPQ